MRIRCFKDAVEDARGVLATFGARQTSEDDCATEVRAAIAKLDAAIEGALMRARPGEIDPSDRLLVEISARELIVLWDRCGTQAQSLILDVKTLFGRYIDL